MVTKRKAETHTASGKATAPLPSALRERAYRLKTLNDVRIEMARVYSESRRAKIDLEHAKGWIYILTQIVPIIKDGVTEERLAEIERRLGVGAS